MDFTGNQETITQGYTFLTRLLSFFDYRSSKSQLGYIRYDRSGSYIQMLKNGQDLGSLSSAVQNMPNNPYRRPLEVILSELVGRYRTVLASGYPRSAIPKVLLILSDGQSIRSVKDVERHAKALKDLGIMVVVLGVGAKSYYLNLKPAASGDPFSFWARYQIQLSSEVPRVANAILLGEWLEYLG